MSFLKLSDSSIINKEEVQATLLIRGEYFLFLDGAADTVHLTDDDVLKIGAEFQQGKEGYTIMPDTGLVVLRHISAVLGGRFFGTKAGHVLFLKGVQQYIPLTEKDYKHLCSVLFPNELYSRPK